MDRRVTEFVKVRKSPKDLPRVIGRGLCDLSSRRIRWGLCVLRFKYLAAPTRCTIETAVGTGLPNHSLHQAYWFYFLNSFISSVLFLCVCSYQFEDFDWRLSQFPQFNFFSLFVFIVCYPVFTLSVLCACRQAKADIEKYVHMFRDRGVDKIKYGHEGIMIILITATYMDIVIWFLMLK